MATRSCLSQMFEHQRPDAVAEAALWLALEFEPGLDVAHYLQRLQFYAEAVSERMAPRVPLGEALFQLSDYLFNDRGFSADGDLRSTPERTFLHSVIDHRHGSALSITLIYLTVGRWLGLPLEAVSFPGRMLLRYTDAEGPVIFDPGQGGIPLQEQDLASLFHRTFSLAGQTLFRPWRFLSTTGDKMLLVCVLRQLKQGYLQRGDARRALWAQEQILQLTPDAPSGFRERGQLYELLDCRIAAAEDYCRYLELSPDASDAEPLRKRLPQLLQHPVTFH